MNEIEIYKKIVELRMQLDSLFYLDYTNGERNNMITLGLSEELDELLVLYLKQMYK